MNFVVVRGKGNRVLFTEEQKDYIVEQYLTDNRTLGEISKSFNVSSPTIRGLLDSMDIKPKSKMSYSAYKVNQDYFEKIDSEEKAYWLGFLYADGNIAYKDNSVRIILAEKDGEHLRKFAEAIKSTHPIKDSSKAIGEKTYKLKCFYISNKKMCADLINKGCIPNKSLVLEFPSEEQVPKDLRIHFIRGYFDGDGSISYTTYRGKHSNRKHYKLSLLGTEQFLNKVAFELKLNVVAKRDKGKNHYTLYIGGNNQTRKIAKILYENSTIFLDRKKEKANELIEYVDENPYIVWNKGLTLEDY